MSQLGGGLRWFGVSKTGSSTTSRILAASKADREKQAKSAPKVGSAVVLEADDWMAAAQAHQAAREKAGAVGNPFEDASALVKEAKRQAVDDDDEFAIPAAKKQRADSDGEDADDAPADAPSLPPGLSAAPSLPPGLSSAPKEAPAVELSREQKREVELSVMELQDELEEEGVGDDEIEAQCEALRARLLEKAAAEAA